VSNNNISGDSSDTDGVNMDVVPTASNSVTPASSSNKKHESHQPAPKTEWFSKLQLPYFFFL